MSNIYTIKDSVPVEEESKLVEFIDKHWKHNHSLVKSRSLLYFQHYDPAKRAFNFIVAENKETGEYDALTGYIPTSQYDPALAENGDYWGAIWKRRDDIDNSEVKLMGMVVWQRLKKLPYYRSYGGIGTSEKAQTFYKAARYNTYSMSQYYIANENYDDFKIAKNPQIGCDIASADGWTIKFHPTISDIDVPEYAYMPQKSKTFFVNRYEHHPIYKYVNWGIYDPQGKIRSLWVLRRMIVGNASAYRVVDALGNLSELPCLYSQIQRMLHDESCEYVDFMNYGIGEDIFARIGFKSLDLNQSEIIIPNYFEPFVQENINVGMIILTKNSQYMAFKADADQDRPNVL